MVEQGVTCVLVDLGDRLGIVTDRDLRTRVIADGAGPGTPISDVMSAPAWTVAPDRSGTEALLEMLDHGSATCPSGRGGSRRARRRRPPGERAARAVRLRAQIARGADEAEVAGRRSWPSTVIALHDADVPAVAICRTMAGIHDTIVAPDRARARRARERPGATRGSPRGATGAASRSELGRRLGDGVEATGDDPGASRAARGCGARVGGARRRACSDPQGRLRASRSSRARSRTGRTRSPPGAVTPTRGVA